MKRILGKTREMKKNMYGYGYFGGGGQGGAFNDGAAQDLFEETNSENDKEKEGYYPRDEEEEDELFIHDLYRSGLKGQGSVSYQG